MKYLPILFLLFSNGLMAQSPTCDCRAELDFAYRKVKKSISFKDQFDKEGKAEFNDHYQSLVSSSANLSLYDCFLLLNDLIEPLRDNHLYIDGNVAPMSLAELKDPAKLKAFRETGGFGVFPRSSRDLDSLSAALQEKSMASVEGIYYYGQFLEVGVYGTGPWYGVVLQSELPSWEAGELILRLEQVSGEQYRNTSGNFVSKKLVHYQERIVEGTHLRMGWSKDPSPSYFDRRSLFEETYGFKQLEDGVQYLKLGSFNAFGDNLALADSFAASLEGKLTAEALVVDLRGNTGGGPRCSGQFFELLSDYAEFHPIYVLVNYSTISNAEQFTADLKRLPSVTVLGIPTNGTVSYGRNKSNSHTFPSGHFRIHITDSRHPQYLEFEEVGIVPDVRLESDRDWIEQVLEYIKKS